MNEKKEGIAIVPGSFDPITNGHINIAKRAAELYNKVYLAVMINKDKIYTFTLEERVRLAKIALEDTNIEVISSEGMLWKLAKDLNAAAIVKGYRNEKDLEYERQMAEFNKKYNPKAQTIILKCDPNVTNLSSTLVRRKLLNGEALDGLIPEKVNDEIKKLNKF